MDIMSRTRARLIRAFQPDRRHIRIRLLLRIAALFLLWSVALSTTYAAVRFDMFVGYDGIVPQGSWFPISFEVQNDGPGFVAEVEISPSQFNSAHTRTMVVELPTGTTKRLVMPMFAPASYSPGWNARLLDEKGRVRAETTSQRVRRLNESAIPLAASLSRSLPPLPEIKNRPEELRPVFARLQPSVFPDNPIPLEGLDTIYLSSERALDLKVNQIGPLMAWLYGGGHLIVSLEQINHLSGSGEWLKQLLPCEVTGMTTLDRHSELQNWLTSGTGIDGRDQAAMVNKQRRASTGPVPNPFVRLEADGAFEQAPIQAVTVRARDAQVLIGPASTPLALTARRGRGMLTVLTFTPELEPFRSWRNAPYFWAKAIDLPPEFIVGDSSQGYRSGGRPVDGIFGALIDSKQVRKLPVHWLLMLLLAYLAVIGPLDQYWLKKLNRQMLTWITFPVYVAFFSLLIYFIGYKLRAGEREWNELHVVDIIPHGDTADIRGRSFGSIYSPVNARYLFASDIPFSTFRGEFSGHFSGGQEASRAQVQQQPAGFRADASVPVWTSQLFVSDWWRQDSAPVSLTVTDTEVTVDNNLDVPITEARVAIQGQLLELGQIPANEKKTFPRRGARSTQLSPFVQSHAANFLSAVSTRQQAFGETERFEMKDIPGAVMAASFVELNNTPNNYNNFAPPSGFDLSDLVERGEAVLLAWAPNHSLLKPLNQFPTQLGRRDTLLRVSAEVKR